MEKPTVAEIGRVLAKSHVEWFLAAIKPLLIEHFEHGFKHGTEISLETLSSDSKMNQRRSTHPRREVT